MLGFGKIRIFGRYSPAGLLFAAAVLATDQIYKWWMIEIYDIAARGRVALTPFFDLVMVWNRGISYGLLSQETDLGRYALIGAGLVAVAILYLWLANTRERMVAWALGLIIGGALSNVVDRVMRGAVADFFSAHAFGFYWYVFNLSDVAIVAGVGVLLYDSFTDTGTRDKET